MTTAYTIETTSEGAFAPAREQAATMERFLGSATSMAATHEELETYVKEEGREYERRLLQAHLDLRGAAETRVAVKGADGIERTTVRDSSRPLRTVVGNVHVPRMAYQAPEVPGLHPMDAALNLPDELFSHGVRRLLAEQVARSSYEEAVAHVSATTGVAVHKRQMEELAIRAAQDFDGFYATRTKKEEPTDDLLVLTFDAKGIVMRREDLRPATKKAAEQGKHKLATRLSKGEKRNRKRMAQVAAIYTVAPFPRAPMDVVRDLRPVHAVAPPRPRPVNKRVSASVADEPREVILEKFREADRRDPDHRRRWVVLVDGNRDQIALIKSASREVGAKVTLVLDLMHVLEYLWKAAYCFHDDGTKEAEAWVEQRLFGLLNGQSAGDLARGMRRLAAAHKLAADKRKAVDACARYLVNNSKLLHYDRALRDGLPIGTGVIEGACRYLVKDRMDRTGARWSLHGAEAVLRLRALVTNGDFVAYWAFHLEQDHARTHRARYAARRVPTALPRSRPALRSVK